jgi:DNA-binding transcriptional MerR regulator
MFKIGDFSKLSRVPVKTLRFYDEIGLLKPKGVDRFTRYRYYELDQLPLLYRILGLKELGFSLEQIGRLLESELPPDQLKRMLEKRKTEIEVQIEQEHIQLRRVENRLRDIEMEG